MFKCLDSSTKTYDKQSVTTTVGKQLVFLALESRASTYEYKRAGDERQDYQNALRKSKFDEHTLRPSKQLVHSCGGAGNLFCDDYPSISSIDKGKLTTADI